MVSWLPSNVAKVGYGVHSNPAWVGLLSLSAKMNIRRESTAESACQRGEALFVRVDEGRKELKSFRDKNEGAYRSGKGGEEPV